jgi:predicted enzyme related to lactoylglutathione lyase
MDGRTERPYLVIVLDTTVPEQLTSFWTKALGYERSPRSEEPYTVLVPPFAGPPELILQRVPERKAIKNRMHLDLRVRDLAAEKARLEDLGATQLSGEIEEQGFRWIVMADPEGNEFCLGTEPFERAVPRSEVMR